MPRVIVTTLAALLLAPLALAAPGDAAVREEDLAATIRFLAAPELEGRHAAERGGAVASAFVAARLESIGWLPAGDETPLGRSWFQSIGALEAAYDDAASTLEASGGPGPAARFEGSSGKFLVLPDRADTARASGPLVFAGFGIRAPEYGHDDYEGLDVQGHIVLVFSGEPGETDPASKWNGTRPTRHALAAAKGRLAQSLGAVAILVAPNPAGRALSAADLVAGRKDEISRPWLGLEDAPAPLPLAYVDPAAAAAILEGTGVDLVAASAQLETGKRASRALPARAVSISLAYRDRRRVALRNVVARLGAGKGLDGEAVVLGAHFDHLGTPGGTLFPGADDNASGIAGLLAAAAALRAALPAGSCEVIVGGWTGEEEGRLGSIAFLRHPPVAKERIRAAVNLDVLGRPNMDRKDYADALQILYSAAAPALRALATGANEGLGLDLRFYGGVRFQPVSDHYTFFEAGIPVVYPFAGYIADYHRPSDTPDRIDLPRVARSARYVARLVRSLAEQREPIRLDPTIKEAPPPDPFERPDF